MLQANQMQYVLDFLAGSGRIGELLLRHKDALDFAKARVFPASAKDCDFQWSCSGIAENGLAEFELDIVHVLSSGGIVCLFRECDFRRNDPCITHCKCPMLFIDDDVFYLLDVSSVISQIRETIKRANKFMLMCACHVCSMERLREGHNMTYDQLNEIISNSGVAVCVGVFDDEGVCCIPFQERK